MELCEAARRARQVADAFTHVRRMDEDAGPPDSRLQRIMGAAGRLALEAAAMGARLRRSIMPRRGKARAVDSKRRLFETSARSQLLGDLQQPWMARGSCAMRNVARRSADWHPSDRAALAGRCRAGGEPPIGSRDRRVAKAAAVEPPLNDSL